MITVWPELRRPDISLDNRPTRNGAPAALSALIHERHELALSNRDPARGHAMKLCGTTMLAMFVAALAALIALWVLKTFGCPGAHRLGRLQRSEPVETEPTQDAADGRVRYSKFASDLLARRSASGQFRRLQGGGVGQGELKYSTARFVRICP